MAQGAPVRQAAAFVAKSLIRYRLGPQTEQKRAPKLKIQDFGQRWEGRFFERWEGRFLKMADFDFGAQGWLRYHLNVPKYRIDRIIS